jgi:hypothetical protein
VSFAARATGSPRAALVVEIFAAASTETLDDDELRAELEAGRTRPDEILWPRVQNGHRWLMTADKGFADLRLNPPGSHGGLILLRLQEGSRHAYMELAAIALEQRELRPGRW